MDDSQKVLQNFVSEMKRCSDRVVRIGDIANVHGNRLEGKMDYGKHAEVQDFSEAVFDDLNKMAKDPPCIKTHPDVVRLVEVVEEIENFASMLSHPAGGRLRDNAAAAIAPFREAVVEGE